MKYFVFVIVALHAYCSSAIPLETEEAIREKRQVPVGVGVGVGVAPVAPAGVGPAVVASAGGIGACPGGASLGRACDAKRPWPQCPPQSYCFAVNTVDIGPYYCCPVWSTYGAAWRPQTWYYPYFPPNPYPFPWPAGIAPGPAGLAAPLPVGAEGLGFPISDKSQKRKIQNQETEAVAAEVDAQFEDQQEKVVEADQADGSVKKH